MASQIDNQTAEVKVRRYSDLALCDVVVLIRGQEMILSCPDYSQAVKWARVECKTYGLPDAFAVERVG
jgi:hypothetical protein